MKKNPTTKKTSSKKSVLTKADQERIAELTGGDTDELAPALDQWEQEREALAALYDENQALEIYMNRAKILITSYKEIIKQLNNEAGMFVTQRTRDKIKTFWNEVKDMEGAVKKAAKVRH